MTLAFPRSAGEMPEVRPPNQGHEPHDSLARLRAATTPRSAQPVLACGAGQAARSGCGRSVQVRCAEHPDQSSGRGGAGLDVGPHDDEPHTGGFNNRLNWLRASVLGANDGIVTTAGLVMGVAGATSDRSAIAVAGVAGLAAGAFSMAAGEYVSVSTQRDSEQALLAKERRELARGARGGARRAGRPLRRQGPQRGPRAPGRPAAAPSTTPSPRTPRPSWGSTPTT